MPGSCGAPLAKSPLPAETRIRSSSTTATGLGTRTSSGSDSDTTVLPGFYLGLGGTYQLNAAWSIQAAGRYQSMAECGALQASMWMRRAQPLQGAPQTVIRLRKASPGQAARRHHG